MSSSHLALPVVTIDPTFATVIHDVFNANIPSEKFWISCYKTSHPSVHATINAELHPKDRDLVVLKPEEGDVSIVRDDVNYTVSCPSLGIPSTLILPPVQEYLDHERSNSQKPQRITAFDIAPDGSKFATGFLDGSVFISPTTPLGSLPEFPIPRSITVKESRAISRPHLSTVTHLQFFPSSRVLLSAGADFALNILPAEMPVPTPPAGVRVQPARTLRGHTRSVTSTAIIGPGRNVLSSSLDATLKLWDISSSSVISTLLATSPILSMSLGERSPAPPDGEEPAASVSESSIHPNEVPETQSKIVFCGLQDGTFETFDLRLKVPAYHSPRPVNPSGGPNAISYSRDHHLLATGSVGGLVTLYDTRALGTAVTSFGRNESGIEDIQFFTHGTEIRLAIATADGLPYVAEVVPEGLTVCAELVGADCDPVCNVRVRSGSDGKSEVWTASHDAIVRRYLI